jgi:hypothetical protein
VSTSVPRSPPDTTYTSFHLLPTLTKPAITQIVIGTTITLTGIFNPFLLAGPILAALGSGTLILLDATSPAGHWIGFQVLLGIGVGLCLTIPLMLAQVVVGPKDVSIATAIMICMFPPRSFPKRWILGDAAKTLRVVAQSLSSAIFIPVAQVVFQNTLLPSLRPRVPGISSLTVIAAGANKAAIEGFPEELRQGIVESYARALSFTFAIGVPLAGVGLGVAVFMPWFQYHDEGKKRKVKAGSQGGDEAGKEETVGAEEKSAGVVESSEDR